MLGLLGTETRRRDCPYCLTLGGQHCFLPLDHETLKLVLRPFVSPGPSGGWGLVPRRGCREAPCDFLQAKL